jgi:hypothetical protein
MILAHTAGQVAALIVLGIGIGLGAGVHLAIRQTRPKPLDPLPPWPPPLDHYIQSAIKNRYTGDE